MTKKFPKVEKIDSPIGDENKTMSKAKMKINNGRENRFPDRGREPRQCYYNTCKNKVEKIDSPIGDENLSCRWHGYAFILRRENRFPDRGRELCEIEKSYFLSHISRENRFPDRGRELSSLIYASLPSQSRENRFPDRGREQCIALSTKKKGRVEKIDSPIGDENIFVPPL